MDSIAFGIEIVMPDFVSASVFISIN